MPQTFKKVILKDGHVTTETFTVSERKIPLADIRERTLKKHEQLGLICAHTGECYDAMTREEIINRLKQLGESAKVSEAAELNDIKKYLKGIERTRHLMIWADNSTLLNHRYLLMTVNVLYDEVVFYTNKEMEEQGKGNIDVQSLVERPQVYILARCGSSEAEQLARKICLEGLNNKITTSGGIKMTDVMRLFHGDGPQQEFESDEQKGGHAGRAACSGDARRYNCLAVSLSRPYLSLNDRLNKVHQGPAGRTNRNGGLKTFKNLRLEELRGECHARGLPTEGNKKDLEEIFKEKMGIIQRVPAMMFFDQEKTLDDLGKTKQVIVLDAYFEQI